MKVVLSLVCIAGIISFTGCGVSTTAGVNSATSLTNVQLSQNNYRVIGRISGTANNWYVLGVGGLLSKNLYGAAKNEMLRKADLNGKARAVIDVTYDTHVRSILIFYADYTVTCTGTLIEFTEYGLQSTGQVLPDEAPETGFGFRRHRDEPQPRQRTEPPSTETYAPEYPEAEIPLPVYPEDNIEPVKPVEVEPIAVEPQTSSTKGTNVFGDRIPFVERNAAVVNKEITVRITGDATLPQPGAKAFTDYISKNFDHAAAARCGNEHGRIQLDFHVAQDGKPFYIKVLKSVCPTVDRNVMKLVADGPRWTSNGSQKAQLEISF
jgi:hypothetical protein